MGGRVHSDEFGGAIKSKDVNAYFIFSNRNSSKWGWLLGKSEYRHVDVIIADHSGAVYVNPKGKLCSIRTLGVPVMDLIERFRTVGHVTEIIGVSIQDIPQQDPFPLLSFGATCNEMARKMAGVDLPLTTTPACLRRYLFLFDGVRNYKMFYALSRDKSSASNFREYLD